MIKRNVVKLAIAGLLAGAAVAHAGDSPFPLAGENGPFQRYMDGVTIEAKTGAVETIYPRAEIKTYVATGDVAKERNRDARNAVRLSRNGRNRSAIEASIHGEERRRARCAALRLVALCCRLCGDGLDCSDKYYSPESKMPRSGAPPVSIPDLDTHRRALYKFAMMQLRNETHAEDCVQEALAAAIQSASVSPAIRRCARGSSESLSTRFSTTSAGRAVKRRWRLRTTRFAWMISTALYKEDGHRVEPPAGLGEPRARAHADRILRSARSAACRAFRRTRPVCSSCVR